MARDGGRIVIVTDLPLKRLLWLAEEIALDRKCGIEDLRDDDRDGFHIYDTEAKSFIPDAEQGRWLTGVPRERIDAEVFVDHTKEGDSRLTIDWWVMGRCQEVVQSIADSVENRIEGKGYKVLESYDD